MRHRYEYFDATVSKLPLFTRSEDGLTMAKPTAPSERGQVERHQVVPACRGSTAVTATGRDRRRRRPQRDHERGVPGECRPETLGLERRPIFGGAAITEELRPGFWFTTFSYALSLLRPDIIHELELTKHGFMPLLMSSTFAPMENGDYPWLGQDHNQNLKEIARHSKHDADAYDAYNHDVNRVLQAIKPLLDAAPPDIFSDDPEELVALAMLGSRFRKMDKRVLHDAVRLLTGSAADFLDDYFESDILKGYLASTSIIGTKVGPYSQGSGLVLLYHMLGEHDGEFGLGLPQAGQRWGSPSPRPRGPRASASRSGSSRRSTGSSPAMVAPRASPSTTARSTRTDRDLGPRPRRTFTELVDPRELPTDLNDAIRRFRFQGTSAKVNFALDGYPRYPALGDRTDQYRGFTNIGPSMEYLERAFDDAKYGWYSKRPYIDTAIQSAVDPDMAPRQGRHVVLRAVRAISPQGERLGHGERALRRHRPGDPRIVLPGLRGPGAAAGDPDAARHRADRRAQRGQHLRRRVPRAPDVLLPAGPGLVQLPDADRRLLPVWLRHAPRRLRDGRARQAGRAGGPQGSGACGRRCQGRRRERLRRFGQGRGGRGPHLAGGVVDLS